VPGRSKVGEQKNKKIPLRLFRKKGRAPGEEGCQGKNRKNPLSKKKRERRESFTREKAPADSRSRIGQGRKKKGLRHRTPGKKRGGRTPKSYGKKTLAILKLPRKKFKSEFSSKEKKGDYRLAPTRKEEKKKGPLSRRVCKKDEGGTRASAQGRNRTCGKGRKKKRKRDQNNHGNEKDRHDKKRRGKRKAPEN